MPGWNSWDSKWFHWYYLVVPSLIKRSKLILFICPLLQNKGTTLNLLSIDLILRIYSGRGSLLVFWNNLFIESYPMIWWTDYFEILKASWVLDNICAKYLFWCELCWFWANFFKQHWGHILRWLDIEKLLSSSVWLERLLSKVFP